MISIIMMQIFTSRIPIRSLSGSFTDPFYPWLQYEYTVLPRVYDYGDFEPINGLSYPVVFSIESTREDNSEVCGYLYVKARIGREKVKDEIYYDNKYELCSPLIKLNCCYNHDIVEFTIKHIQPPNITSYKCKITEC